MACVAVVLLGVAVIVVQRQANSSADRLLLLVPDGMKFSDPKVTMWIDAGSEEGLHVVAMHDSEFLRPFLQKTDFSGVILPDSIHKEASDLLVVAVRRFVADGGSL